MASITSIESHTTASTSKVLPTLMIYRSANSAVLVDYKRRFLNVEIGWPSSVGDYRVFENSYLNSTYEAVFGELGTVPLATGDGIEEDIPAFILGDSAYKNSRHFVTTYKVTECDADRAAHAMGLQGGGILAAITGLSTPVLGLFAKRTRSQRRGRDSNPR